MVVSLQGCRIQLGFVDLAFSRSPDKASDRDVATVHSILETLQIQADQFAHRTLDLSPIDRLIRQLGGLSDSIASVLQEVSTNLEQLWIQMELVRNHALWWGWWIVRLQDNRAAGR